jgi:hypothetical protein
MSLLHFGNTLAYMYTFPQSTAYTTVHEMELVPCRGDQTSGTLNGAALCVAALTVRHTTGRRVFE